MSRPEFALRHDVSFYLFQSRYLRHVLATEETEKPTFYTTALNMDSTVTSATFRYDLKSIVSFVRRIRKQIFYVTAGWKVRLDWTKRRRQGRISYKCLFKPSPQQLVRRLIITGLLSFEFRYQFATPTVLCGIPIMFPSPSLWACAALMMYQQSFVGISYIQQRWLQRQLREYCDNFTVSDR